MSEKDGGPAFPVQEPLEQSDDDRYRFVTVYRQVGGMSLRDYFAAQALPVIQSFENESRRQMYEAGEPDRFSTAYDTAHAAYAMADAMLKARAV